MPIGDSPISGAPISGSEEAGSAAALAVGIIPYYYLLMLPEGIGGLAFQIRIHQFNGKFLAGPRLSGTFSATPRTSGKIEVGPRLAATISDQP
jgi:hypothetical protein